MSKPNMVAGDTSEIEIAEYHGTDKKVGITRNVPYADGGFMSREAMAAHGALKPATLDPEDIGTLVDSAKL